MKLILRIFNLVYIALAAVACVALFTKPLVAINAGLALEKQDVSNLLYDSFSDQVSEEDFGKAIEKSLDEDGKLRLSIKLEIPSTAVITKDSKAITNDLTEQLNDTVNDVVDKLNGTIKELAKIMAKDAGKEAIRDSIAEQIGGESEAAKQTMIEHGITDEYLDDMTTKIMDSLLGENGAEKVETVDELMAVITPNISEIVGMLGSGENPLPDFEGDPEAKTAEMTDEIKEELEKALEENHLLVDGKIVDMDQAIDDFLADFIDQLLGEGGEDGSKEGEKAPEETPAALRRLIVREGEEEKESKLKQKIRDLLNQKIEELNINEYVEQFWYAPLIFTGLLVFPWALFIIVTIIRTIRKSKCWTKPWVVFFFAFLQVIFGIALYLVTTKFIGKILEVISLPEDSPAALLNNASLSVQTSSFIPSILYLVMIPLTIVYIILAHRVKKQHKIEKKERKAAKKAA